MFENNTYATILERMLSRVSNKFDKREGSVIFDTHSPTALEFQFLYIELERIIQEAYGDTASRDFLILRCKERGITPYPATNAVLKGKFTPKDIDLTGKRFNIDELNYTAIEKVADGEYLIQCETKGIIGNQFLGTMIPIDYIIGLETAELNYLEKTNAIPGVGKTKVTRVWNADIRPAEMIPSESVKSWYENIIQTMSGDSAAWLTAVFTAGKEKKLTTGGTVLLTILNSDFEPASETLIQTVQTEIDPEVNAGEGYGLAPIGHVVTVKSAESLSVFVKTTIVFNFGYGWNNLQNSINNAVSDYLLELRKEWADVPYIIVRKSQIETRILNINGIIDIMGTQINGSEDNLTLNKFQVPVFGGVSE